MDQEIKQKWTAALRSGKYRQTKGRLRKVDVATDWVGHCCLGVLCDLVDPEGWDSKGNHRGLRDMPSRELYDRVGLHLATASTLVKKNDDGETFAEIADYIDANL